MIDTFRIFLLGFSFVIIAGCGTQKNVATTANNLCKGDSLRIAFYNVENLFDLYDNPEKIGDEEFTPKGKREWTKERFDKKLNDLSKVINTLGNGKAPAILGLSEVENSLVLDALLQTPAFSKSNFKYLHQDSPDRRGIDVCLIYNSDLVNINDWEAIKIEFPKEPDYTSRDIVYANLGLSNGEVAHVFVNHWPSRYGGTTISEPRRIQAATTVKQKIDKILSKDKHAKIILIGDFNDEPSNKSLKDIIQAAESKKELSNSAFYNACNHMASDSTKGTYNYKGNWSFLDQVIVGKNLLNAKKGFSSNGKANVFVEKWMLYFDKKTGYKPNRTYGRNYYGGFSDHLPIYIDLVCNIHFKSVKKSYLNSRIIPLSFLLK